MLMLARWTMAHRRIVVLGWITLAIGILAVSSSVGTRAASNFALPGTDSQRAIDLLQHRFPAQAGDADQIVFPARTAPLTAAANRRTVDAMLARVKALPHVTGVVSPCDAQAPALSKDRQIGFATVTFDEAANALPKPAVQRVITTA